MALTKYQKASFRSHVHSDDQVIDDDGNPIVTGATGAGATGATGATGADGATGTGFTAVASPTGTAEAIIEALVQAGIFTA